MGTTCHNFGAHCGNGDRQLFMSKGDRFFPPVTYICEEPASETFELSVICSPQLLQQVSSSTQLIAVTSLQSTLQIKPLIHKHFEHFEVLHKQSLLGLNFAGFLFPIKYCIAAELGPGESRLFSSR